MGLKLYRNIFQGAVSDDTRDLLVRRDLIEKLGQLTWFYHCPAGETLLKLELMRPVDAQFLETPWYGSRQMARQLRREGHVVGRKRVTFGDQRRR
jgi:hypothetical protein